MHWSNYLPQRAKALAQRSNLTPQRAKNIANQRANITQWSNYLPQRAEINDLNGWGCPKSRKARKPECRNAGMPECRNAGNQDPEILKPGMTFREGKRAK